MRICFIIELFSWIYLALRRIRVLAICCEKLIHLNLHSFFQIESIDSRPVVAAVTFIVILIGLGIPVWWNTTAVQRAYFSLDELSNLQLISGNDHSLTIVYGTVDSLKKANERSKYYDYISNTSGKRITSSQ